MNLTAHSVSIFIFLNLFLAAPGNAKPFEELNEQARKAYESGQYNEALEYWKEIYYSGNSDPDLIYNIGLCESMLGNLPGAMLFFEKAMRHKPSDQELRAAIQRERSKIENAVIPVQPFFLLEWWKALLAFLRPGMWALFGLILLLASLIKWLIINRLLKSNFYIPGKFWIYTIIGFSFVLISIFSYREQYRQNEGIIFSSCELNQGPSVQSPILRIIQPGEKVIIMDEISDWYKVNLLNLDEGWLKKECLQIIDAGENL